MLRLSSRDTTDFVNKALLLELSRLLEGHSLRLLRQVAAETLPRWLIPALRGAVKPLDSHLRLD